MNKHGRALKILIIGALALLQAFLLQLDLKPSFTLSKFAWDRGDKLICISDFVRYYVAGKMARSPDRERIYEISAHYSYVHDIIQPFQIAHESAINFTPAAITVMSFFSVLPFFEAYLVWCTTGLLCAFVALGLFLTSIRKFKILDALILCLLVFDSFTAFLNIRVGQWVDWLIAFYILFFWSSVRKKEVMAGILLGFLSVKPQYAIPVAVITLIQRRWKTLLSAGFTFFVLTAYAASLIGWHNVLMYSKIATNLECLLDVGIAGHAQASLRGFFTNILPADKAFEVSSSLYLFAVGVFAIGVWYKRDSLATNIMWVWALSILLGLVFSPHSLNYDMTLFAVPAALTLETVNPIRIFQMQPISKKIWHVLMLIYPLCSWYITCCVPLRMTCLFVVLNTGLILAGLLYLKKPENSEKIASSITAEANST